MRLARVLRIDLVVAWPVTAGPHAVTDLAVHCRLTAQGSSVTVPTEKVIYQRISYFLAEAFIQNNHSINLLIRQYINENTL